MDTTEKFKNMSECNVPWGEGWHVCRHHKNKSKNSDYGGCYYWVYTDFILDDGVRHPGWCNRISVCEEKRKKMFDDILDDNLFEL